MARAAKKDDDYGEVKTKDFAGAVSLYRQDIKPAKAAAAEKMQESSTAYKAIKKQCNIQPGAAKDAFKAYEKEEAKRDDWLRGFVGTFNELVGHEVLVLKLDDLVDRAQGGSRPNLVPVGDDD